MMPDLLTAESWRWYAFRDHPENEEESGQGGMSLRFVVPGKFVATREIGRKERERLDQVASQVAAGDLLEIDLTGVEAMTISFADEFFGRFIASRAGSEQDDRGIVIDGPGGASGDDLQETLEAVLDRRGIGVLWRSPQGDVTVIGGPAWFASTFEQALDLKVFRATQLAERLDLSPQATNGRLKKLSAAGAVLRERIVPDGGGKEFEYRVATATP
jgi:hypothetical protein